MKVGRAELAEKAYFRQAAISQIETGKRDVTASEVVYLSYALDKPITYLYPMNLFDIDMEEDELFILEQELVLQVRLVVPDELKKLIAQAKVLADFSNGKTLCKSTSFLSSKRGKNAKHYRFDLHNR